MEMRGRDVEAVMAALDEVEMAWDKLATLPVHGLGAGQILDVLDRLGACQVFCVSRCA